MWKGKWNDHINKLYEKYEEKFGCEPDTYEEITYEAMDYNEFCYYIEKSIQTNKEINEIC